MSTVTGEPLSKWAARVLALPMHLLPTTWVLQLVVRAARKRAKRLQPRDALRFLFEIDRHLYGEQGFQAVRYGDGVHTKHRHMNYHAFFSSRIAATERVLDVGCGIGAVARHIAEATGATVVGIDYTERNIKQAKKQFGHPLVEFRLGDALTDLDAEPFDVIVLSNVLEHISQRPEFLRHLADTTSARRFLIRVPMFDRDWRVPLKREVDIDWRLDDDHKTEYTLESFEAEMNEAGFAIVHCQVHWGEIWAEVHRATTDR